MKKTILFFFILSSLIGRVCFGQLSYNVDVLPTNRGGASEFKRIFKQELIYPVSSLEKKETGKVRIDFIIRADSTVTEVKVKNSVSPAIDAEALRIFERIQWIPAIKDGKAVASNWNTIFNFEPGKYSKICKERGYVNFPYIAEIDSSGTLVKHPQQMPVYPDGIFALRDFIKANLEYPRQARLGNLQGKVVLYFVVEPSGLATNISVKNSVGGGCDEEAIRIMQLIKWYPGKKDNKLVRVPMTYPFYFILNEDFKDNSLGEQK